MASKQSTTPDSTAQQGLTTDTAVTQTVDKKNAVSKTAASATKTAESIVPGQPRTKPEFKLPAGGGSASLHDRLRSFLPQMAESNKTLTTDGTQNIEDVNEDEDHIVMELGLGVLEHKSSSEDDSSTDSDSDESEGSSEPKEDALNTLLGRSKTTSKPDIQEIG